ncbi:hypothetical protein BFP71_11015 [Roseivirga misakiensis]|uniref:Potassium channel domain-containing protein n=1 Tax=Roseivirga misakiensis TaxID=1563681 RepID=A0A1E5SY17_9BACT|nr:hypothetical protein BFP71_11015 [Roseivirga misakiensis]
MHSFAQDEIEYNEYSYTEFFQMIEDEEDSVFTLSNALIRANQRVDTMHFALAENLSLNLEAGNVSSIIDNWPQRDSIFVRKPIILNNVQFVTGAPSEDQNSSAFIQSGLYKVHFLEPVELQNSISILLYQSTFEKGLTILTNNPKEVNKAYNPYKLEARGNISFINVDFMVASSEIKKSFQINQDFEESNDYNFILKNSSFPAFDVMKNITLRNIKNVEISSNQFKNLILRVWDCHVYLGKSSIEGVAGMSFYEEGRITILDNHFKDYVMLYKANNPKLVLSTDWEQWFDKFVFNGHAIYGSQETNFNDLNKTLGELVYGRKSISLFQDSTRVQNRRAYNETTKDLSRFYNEFKENYDSENANLVYREIKNLETQRLAYLYKTGPTFDRYFTRKINQFLKIFSAYGTKPSRAIIFSVYVILAFALVYLFFPNYWDSHGKNRIMDRYRFFTKYMKQDSGMHEVYLEEKSHELMASEDFKSYMLESEKGVPKFFMATALPLYRWSVAGTRSFSWILSNVDVLKGKWSDTEDSKKGIKSILLIMAFLIALAYDIFIKILNALMLSINTFTTLGFGEIPIKGLPRYLAIIQGFIGWFMLTIFSVSLISQLLN